MQYENRWVIKYLNDEYSIPIFTTGRNGNTIARLRDLAAYQPVGNYLTAETDPVFSSVSSTFLTSHQPLSDYYEKSETSSCSELSVAFDEKADKTKTISVDGEDYWTCDWD